MPSQGPNYASTAANGDGDVSWNSVHEALTDNGNYAYTANFTEGACILHITSFGFSIPAGSTIQGISTRIQGYAGVNGGDVNVYLKGNGFSLYAGPKSGSWTVFDAEYTYGNSSDLWGTTWTPDIINASDFGVSLYGYPVNNATVNFNADYVSVTVTYLEAGQPMIARRRAIPGIGGGIGRGW